MENNKEVWAKLPTSGGCYKISSLGRVKRVCVYRDGVRIPCEQIIDIRFPVNNVSPRLWLELKSGAKQFYLHQLVAMAFLGYKCDDRNVLIKHMNNDKHDNRLCNLKLRPTKEYCKRVGIEYREDYFFSDEILHIDQLKQCIAVIPMKGFDVFIGAFDTELEAYCAIEMAKKKFEKRKWKL